MSPLRIVRAAATVLLAVLGAPSAGQAHGEGLPPVARGSTRQAASVLVLALTVLLAAPAAAAPAPPVSPAGAASRSLPAGHSVAEGGSVTLDASEDATAGGVAPTSAQWSVSTDGQTFTDIPGATDLTLTLSDVTMSMDGWHYRLRVMRFPVWLEIGPTVLHVIPAVPVVTLHPVDQTVGVGATAIFTAAYGGTAAATTTHWERSTGPDGPWTTIEGATTPALAVGPVGLPESGTRYRARFSNTGGSVTTDYAVLTVKAPPTVTRHPSHTVAPERTAVTFSAEYTGEPPLTARWLRSTDGGQTWELLDAPEGPTLTLDPVTLDMDGWWYRLRVDNEFGTRWTTGARLTVEVARPVVTEHPAPQIVTEGGSATFRAAYGGTDAPVAAQWQVSTAGGTDFQDVPGGTSLPLVLSGVTAEMDGWQYRAQFTNEAGPAWSEPARLTVLWEVPALTLRVTPRVTLVDALPTGARGAG
ncbi:immunoglobulin domain-containing protein [Cellulosimicrobium cellulans]|uniref:immunoglobulin domain-containing protein n=1 Tax=Cellulosimicrobium cellulans TaxID=1710 RepID=UPI00130EDA74|nr:immunoglobulin domain-containing protein [Cellulosimicrobium cellulans]